jgi:YggT family protein
MSGILLTILQLCSLALIAKALLSWIQVRPGTALDRFKYGLDRLTEPVVAPVRRVLPRPGGLDLSVLAILLGINLVLVPVAARL